MHSSTAPTESAPAWFENALAQQAAVGDVVVDGATISFRSWGELRQRVPDVLLVHGGAAHARWWDHLAPLLATDRRVAAIDLSGHGDSAHRSEYSVQRWTDELTAVISAGGLGERPVVVGHSLGGLVTAALARREGPGLGGAVIVDSPLDARGPGAAFGAARVYPTQADAVARFRPVPAQSMLPWVAAHIAKVSVHEVPGGWGWKFDPRIVDIADELPTSLDGLRCPVVLVAGEHGLLSKDALQGVAESDAVALLEVPGAGHAMMLDQPLALLAAIRGVLAGWEFSGSR